MEQPVFEKHTVTSWDDVLHRDLIVDGHKCAVLSFDFPMYPVTKQNIFSSYIADYDRKIAEELEEKKNYILFFLNKTCGSFGKSQCDTLESESNKGLLKALEARGLYHCSMNTLHACRLTYQLIGKQGFYHKCLQAASNCAGAYVRVNISPNSHDPIRNLRDCKCACVKNVEPQRKRIKAAEDDRVEFANNYCAAAYGSAFKMHKNLLKHKIKELDVFVSNHPRNLRQIAQNNEADWQEALAIVFAMRSLRVQIKVLAELLQEHWESPQTATAEIMIENVLNECADAKQAAGEYFQDEVCSERQHWQEMVRAAKSCLKKNKDPNINVGLLCQQALGEKMSSAWQEE